MKNYSSLTDVSVRALVPKSDQYEVFDRSVPGLGIRVSSGGTKAFVLLYRIGGRPRRLTLGRYPVIGLKDARQRASAALSEVANGIDPQTRKKEERQNYQAALFPAVASSFIENYAKRKTTSWAEAERIICKEFNPRWGKLRLQDVTKQHVHKLLDELGEMNGPSAANHAFAVIRKFFNWCVERGELAHSPCVGLKSPFKNVSRDRVLSDDELVRIWLAAETMSYPFGPYIKLLILTAQRRNEVAKLRWEHLDLGKQLWSQPAAANKSKRAHIVPLSALAAEIIEQIPRVNQSYVFPARGSNRPISGFSKWKAQLERLSKTENWTIHDLRRTATTGMASLKVPYNVADLILNHRSAALSGVAGVYNRHEYIEERREGLETWANHVTAQVNATVAI